MNYAKLWILLREDLEAKITEAELRRKEFQRRYLLTKNEKFQMLAFCAHDKVEAYREILELMTRNELREGNNQ